MLGKGPMEDATTTRAEFTRKVAERAEAIVPCGNIGIADQPLEGTTTTALSFINPGLIPIIPNFKPLSKYCK